MRGYYSIKGIAAMSCCGYKSTKAVLTLLLLLTLTHVCILGGLWDRRLPCLLKALPVVLNPLVLIGRPSMAPHN